MAEAVVCIILWRFRDGDKELLLVRRQTEPSTYQWCLPHGPVEPGESLNAASTRHVKLQIGRDCDCQFIRNLSLYNQQSKFHQVVVVFEGNLTDSQKLAPGLPAVEAQWVPIQKALTLALGFEHATIVQKYAGKKKYILVKDAIGKIGMNDATMERWIQQGFLTQSEDHTGRKVIDKREFSRIAHTEQAKKAWHNSFALSVKRREDDVRENLNPRLLQEVSTALGQYRQRIALIQKIHAAWHSEMNVYIQESAVVAAYCIFSKVIRLLRMACDCLEKHYWDTMLLLRPIDEALDLALYFIVTENTEKGRLHLQCWFREDESPSHSVCRKELAKWTERLTGKDKSQAAKEMSRLYGKKSKFVHITHHDIMETYRAQLGDGIVSLHGFEYGACTIPRKIHEIVSFFENEIWTAEGRLYECFHDKLPFGAQDKESLLSHPDPLKKPRVQVRPPNPRDETTQGQDVQSMVDLIRQFGRGSGPSMRSSNKPLSG